MIKTVAVLLTVFNRRDKTLECLKRLYAQLPINGYRFDTYLTNDGSTDGTPEAIREHYPQVRIIDGDGTLFWNRGMHAAWEVAAEGAYDYYLWLNDDTFIYDYALSVLLNDAEGAGAEAIICGATCSSSSGEVTYGGRTDSGLISPTGVIHRCNYFNGNVVLIPKSVFNKVGNLDRTFRHAFGDFDYGLRAAKLGIAIYQSCNFVGSCEAHTTLPRWCNPKVRFLDRLKVFSSPTGGNPQEQFHFDKRHFGLCTAMFHYFTIHLRLVIPKLW